MPNHLSGAAGKTAEPQVEAAGFPDLLMGFKVRLAMFGWHGCNLDAGGCSRACGSGQKKDVFFSLSLAEFSGSGSHTGWAVLMFQAECG